MINIKQNKTMKRLILVLAGIMMMFVFAACGNAPDSNTDSGAAEDTATSAATEEPAADTGTEEPAADTAALSGNVTVAGSTSVQPLSEVLAEAFMGANPDVRIDIQGGGSGQGIKALEEKIADFGSLSREVKDEEKAVVGAEYVVAKDGIAVIVNKDESVADLTMEQLKGIFTGEIKNWKEVGGDDAAIVVVAREEGSGTRDAFNELTGVKADDVDSTVKTAIIQGSTGAVAQTIASTKSSVGYISLGSLDDTVKAVKVEGVDASKDTVLDGSYKLSRPFLYVSGAELSPQAKAYVDFIMSADGQKIVEEEGFISAQ